MSGNSDCKVYVGNLHERVSDRVLYDILIQAGWVIDLYNPRDKETDLRLQNANLQRLQTMPSSFSLDLCVVSLYNQTQDYIAHHSNP